MTRPLLALAAVAAGVILYPLATQRAQNPPGVRMGTGSRFRIVLGAGDTQPVRWDGSVQVSGGKITRVEGWRFGTNDTAGGASWKASTRRAPAQNAAARQAGRGGPMVAIGIIVTAELATPAARFDVQTAQGSFSFTEAEVAIGAGKAVLDGRAWVERYPAGAQLTQSENDEDFPALAQSGDDVWLAYVQFTRTAFSEQESLRQLKEEPKDFEYLSRPAGGDQVFLMHYSKSKDTWDAPAPVSAAKQDVMRAAVAVDGRGRVWVIWSANRNGNFDLYARWQAAGKWSPEIRVTTDAGNDLNPVAATDSGGRVWVAWQGARAGNLDILAAVQNGERFGSEQRVSFSAQSDWDPAIAAAGNGEVAIAWDTYDKGDYDVYVRRMRAGTPIAMEAPLPVAASGNFEARASIAYDGQNRLWAAYEASSVKWGKDFGAYETTGVALYQGHTIHVRCLEGSTWYRTAQPLEAVMPGPVAVRQQRRNADPAGYSVMPNPKLAAERPEGAAAQAGPLPANSFPRIAADGAGTVYLAFRTPAGPVRSPVGTTWVENVVYFDGSRWTGTVPVPSSDGLLDSRPAMAALGSGSLLVVAASDHREDALAGARRRAAGLAGINSDLFASRIDIEGGASQLLEIRPLPAEKPSAPQPEVQPELEQVAAMRAYRAAAGGQTLQLMRGEFHRHTEMSVDGGRDGPLVDAYRYAIDAAYMDWVGCCDHDNGGGHEYFWWLQQKLTDAYRLGAKFVPMFAYERSVRYPEGHRNVVMAARGVRPLPRLPKMDDDSKPTPAPDTQMLYRYLKRYSGIVASHTSGTDMGTDWRDNDPVLEPVVEIYQGDRQNYEMPDAPRSNSERDSIGGWRPLGFVSLALQKGYRLGFQASSDHISTHMSYCNLWVTAPTREGIMEAFRKRRVYGATDNILADVRVGEHFMGEEFTVKAAPAFSVKLRGTAPFAKVHIIRDNQYVYTVEPKTREVNFTWKDTGAARGKTSYYYVRGEQEDGELVWVSPMWIRYQ